MAKGKLSVTEKYAIQGMLHQNISIKDIAEALERTPSTIQNYVDSELAAIHETIARVKAQSVQEVEEEKPEFDIPEDMYSAALVRLKQNTGKHEADCKEILDRTIRKLKFMPENDHKLYVLCIKQLNAKDVMATRSAAGKHGVAIMTGAASERGDESRKKAKPVSRSSRGNTFRPKDNKMM